MKRSIRGFTLIELMVVILIMGILIALLLPAINGAVKTAKDATVTAEINQLATGLADFKSKYGKYPPSRVILREDGIYDTSSPGALSTSLPSVGWFGSETFPTVAPATVNDMSYGQLASQSLKSLKNFWPRAFLVASNGPAGSGALQQHDFNGNGRYDQLPIYLEGHECLVFFLGGIPIPEAQGGPGVSGFASSPQYPFSNVAGNSNRTAPMMEFRTGRLVDNDQDGMYGYVDPLGSGPDVRYYAYFSTNIGGGYDPNDINLTVAAGQLDSLDTNEAGARPYKVGRSTTLVVSPAPNPYTTSAPIGFAVPNSPNIQTPTYVNAESYQLFSPGRDGLYGLGGQYSPTDLSAKLPGDASVNAGNRRSEADNLSNFANGHLD